MSTLSYEPVSSSDRSPGRIGRLLRRRATWVLLDQAVVSGGTFLRLRYLLVYLSEKHFGNYNVLFETLNYLNSLQAALIIYPLTIRGASEGTKHLRQITSASLIFTFLLLPILGVTIIGSAMTMGETSVGFAAAFALLVWQLQETTRRVLMSDLRFAAAVPGDAVGYLGQAVAIALIGKAGHLNLTLTFLIMAAASAVAMAIQLTQIGLQRISLPELRTMAADFWKLAKWMLPNNASTAITALGYWYTLQHFYGAEGAALFGATTFFFKPANPVQSSMSSLIVPAVARAKKEQGDRAATRQALRYLSFGAVLLAPYFALLAFAPEWCIRIASHGRHEYSGIGLYVRLFVINYMFVYTSGVLGSWLAGLGQTRFSFYAQVMNIVATLLIGLPMTYAFGVTGLICGGMISAGSALVATIWFLRRPGPATEPPPAIEKPMAMEPPQLIPTPK